MNFSKSILAAFLVLAAFCVSAQVDVEDRVLGSSQQSQATNTNAQAGVNVAELYYQIQVLQQEVLQLRGMVEEQANEVKKLKQQRLDDYLELDRRLSKVGSGGFAGGATGSSENEDANTVDRMQPAPEDELKIYRRAIDLVLKQRDYDKAIVGLNEYLTKYPTGRYAANAQYWLGEIFLVKGDLESSREWFSNLLKDFPTHRKVPDAKFKLGKVYDMQGDKATAKMLLQEVAVSESSASQLAKEYLSRNFSQ